MKIQAIIVAAGKGARLKSRVAKPLALLRKKPLISYSLKVFVKCPLIDSIVVAVNRRCLADFTRLIAGYRFLKKVKIVAGGKTRRVSVQNGLKALDEDTRLVVIHDAARPLIEVALVRRAVVLGQKEKAVIVAVPVKSTVKKVYPKTSLVEKTLDRNALWEVQTPQVFKKDVILKAHAETKRKNPCDDALLVEDLGIKVKVVMGDYRNIKIKHFVFISSTAVYGVPKKHPVFGWTPRTFSYTGTCSGYGLFSKNRLAV